MSATTGGNAPDELVFEALPPARGRGFATTWWGRSWLKALEDSALDGERLRQGRRHARAGAVGAVSVRPGRLTAVVRHADGTRLRADVLLRRLAAAEWDRLLDGASAEAGHIAALLDREMPPRLVEDAELAGVDLLPGVGDLDPECECGEWDHCAHTAAVCYHVARLLDADPFLLLLLRGRGERELTEELQRRSAARAEEAHAPARTPAHAPARTPAQAPAGEPAAEVYGRRAAPPLPPPPPLVAEPGAGPALRGGIPPAPGLDVEALEFLVADAARRAARMLAEALAPRHASTPPPAPLTEADDAVRMVATGRPPDGIAARLARARGRGAREFATAVRAWEVGGRAGLAALDEEAAPASARALAQLTGAWAAADARPALRARGNRWTVVGEGVQLRCGAEGLWWPFTRDGGRWWPAGPGEADPAAALAAARAAGPTAGPSDVQEPPD
ncbi:SWF or SNF family helicase [Streptomyces sp. PT12]|uniref:SWIM zinc finger family protein n=1 Tax=Streptomyces sp. PT12 TaxID=1510197 RepID=UPI000DE3DA43|nr:SWF or SNF family helicase [Streptomyces sp. PT12]RBM16655.1 SWF or SNF family helicase [Streptomyces sp. PT12]